MAEEREIREKEGVPAVCTIEEIDRKIEALKKQQREILKDLELKKRELETKERELEANERELKDLGLLRLEANWRARTMPKKGEIFSFGRYPRDGKGRKWKTLEWIVLEADEEKGRWLLLSRYGLTVRAFHEKKEEAPWEICSLRKWLNEDFLSEAFDEVEVQKIQSVLLPAEAATRRNPKPGKATWDRIFLLSIPEVRQYMETKEDKLCRATDRAAAEGVRQTEGGFCEWWLRSVGYDAAHAALVAPEIGIDQFGLSNGWSGPAVRPAMWIVR